MTEKNVPQIEVVEEVENEDTQEGKFLTFSLGEEEYGIEIRNVTEIIGIQNITELPDTPAYVKGVINLRGKVIPVIDVRLRFNIEALEYKDRTCIVVVNINNMSVGLIVDTVSEVMDIPAENIDPAPKVNNKSGSMYIKGLGKVGDEVKILLDTQKLLFGNDLEQVADSLAS